MPDTAQFILNRLTEWGIKRVYGYPGDGINGLIGAFHEVGDRLEFIQCRHEEIASFAATAHAKFTGEVGVCMATSGPGAVHLLNGLYDAKLDHQPVVAIIGQQKRMSLGANYQQEVDLNTLYKDVASEYVMTVMDPTQARHVIDRAIRIAKDSRQPTAVIVPEDVQEAEHQEPPRAHGAVFSSLGFSTPLIRPRDEDLKRAAEILNAGEKVAMLIGQGAAQAADEVVQVAELLGAGVAKALNGRAALPDDLPFVTGSIGLLGTKPSYDMMMGCDTLLDGRHELSLRRVAARGGVLPGGADRHRRPTARHALRTDGVQSRRRRQGHAAGADPAASSARKIAPGARSSRARSSAGGG